MLHGLHSLARCFFHSRNKNQLLINVIMMIGGLISESLICGVCTVLSSTLEISDMSIGPQGYTQSVLVSNTECKHKFCLFPQGTFNFLSSCQLKACSQVTN